MTFRSIVSSYKKLINYDGANSKTEYQNSYKDTLVECFFDNIAYTQVKLNSDDITLYDVWIYDGNKKDDLSGHKLFKSYPYDEIKFNIGDYIVWDYGGVESTWLLTSLDKQFNFQVDGRIKKCNNTLKFYVNSKLKSYPCVVDDKGDNKFDFHQLITLPKGIVFVTTQNNDYTNTIGINQRFIFGSDPYRTIDINNFTGENILLITMMKEPVAPDDDVTNQIANKPATDTSNGSWW